MSTRSIQRPKVSIFPRRLAVYWRKHRSRGFGPGRRVGALVVLGGIGGLLGCGEIQPVAPASPPNTDPALYYKDIVIDYPAVTMSTAPGYNTVQLTATALDGNDNPLANVSAPIIWWSSDTTALKVSSTGVLTAVGVSSDIDVTASLTVGGLVTRAARAKVTVTDLTDPPKLATLSIHPVPPDSAVWPVPSPPSPDGLLVAGPYANVVGLQLTDLSYTTYDASYGLESTGIDPQVPLRMLDAAGVPIPGLRVAYSSPDHLRIGSAEVADLDVDPGQVVRTAPAGSSIRVVAKALAYGAAKADTVAYTFTNPFIVFVYTGKPAENGLVDAFYPSEVVIAPYGYVAWFNFWTDHTVDVTFDDPTNVVAPPAGFCTAIRDYYNKYRLPLLDGAFCGAGNFTMPMRPNLASFGAFIAMVTLEIRQFPVPGVYTYHSVSTGATGRIVVR